MTELTLVDATASLKKNGKTFWLASLFLPKEMAAEAATLYAFCRRMDDVADQQDGPADSHPLDQLQRTREELRTGTSEDAIVQGLMQLANCRGLDLQAAECLLDVLFQDASENICIQDEAELLRYCYGAAGTVGLMMAAVLRASGSAARQQAIDLGIAMQLTNIARDVQEDALMGRRYLPAIWVDRLTPEQIVAAAPGSQTARRVAAGIEKTLALADMFYASGAKGFPAIPSNARNGIRIAAAAYRSIGVKLRKRGCDFTRGRVVVSLPSKVCIAAGVLAGYSELERLPSMGNTEELHRVLAGLPGFA
jgi:phytoene synthase